MTIKKYISAAIVALSALAVTADLVVAPALASAQTTPPPSTTSAWGGHSGGGMPGGRMGMQPGVFGTVTAINGTTLTVSGKQGRPFGAPPSSNTSGTQTQTAPTTPVAPATVIYTVDAANATVRKNNATSTVASIAVGDTVVVRGTVSGTSVTATSIIDGVMPMRGGNGSHGGPGMGMGSMGSSTRSTSMPVSPITGNGQPAIAGSVSAISGNTLTVTNKSNVTYTVDVTNAKIVQGQTTVTVSNVAVGDNVIVQGAVSGTSVTASSVIDQKAGQQGMAPSGTTGGQGGQAPVARGGIFGAIGSFFSHIFGF